MENMGVQQRSAAQAAATQPAQPEEEFKQAWSNMLSPDEMAGGEHSADNINGAVKELREIHEWFEQLNQTGSRAQVEPDEYNQMLSKFADAIFKVETSGNRVSTVLSKASKAVREISARDRAQLDQQQRLNTLALKHQAKSQRQELFYSVGKRALTTAVIIAIVMGALKVAKFYEWPVPYLLKPTMLSATPSATYWSHPSEMPQPDQSKKGNAVSDSTGPGSD